MDEPTVTLLTLIDDAGYLGEAAQGEFIATNADGTIVRADLEER